MQITIPKNSIFRPIVKRFTATFGTPTVGQYNFGVAANKNVSILPIAYGNLFFISILNFSANISESAFLENVISDPQLLFMTKQNGINIFGGPQPLIKYLPQNEVNAFFRSRQRGDFLTGTFTGSLGQSASLIGPSSVIAVVAMNIFEIQDQKWIRDFEDIKPGDISEIVIPQDVQRRI